jgi:glycosyltransferase involved in cell wall biosynthesis
MIRVLQVYPQMNNAGTERVIFNLYENIDTTKVQFDFLVERPGEMDEKINRLGGKIHYLYSENKHKYYKDLVEFFQKHPEYRVIHTHTHARMGIVLKAAKKCDVPCRIAHSHNARTDLPKVAAFIKSLTSIPIECYSNYFFACSNNAAKWLFPHRVNKCKILYNGINLEDYLFNNENRLKHRKALGISDNDFVMIHVGRFAKQKNHEFLIKILNQYAKSDDSNWKMLLVGEGPLESSIKSMVNDMKLSEHVIFLGNRSDVNELYSAADMFVFPSLHEGLGIVVIEAQASGLPCIVSDAVPPEADMEVGMLKSLSLNENVEKWTELINANKQHIDDRNSKRESILKGKYNIKLIAKQMQTFYMEQGSV